MPVISTLKEFRAMSPRQQEEWRGAFWALDRMRHRGESITVAAREVGVSPATVRSYVEPALVLRAGRWAARPTDRLLRVMELLAEDGPHHEVAIRSSSVASALRSYWAAVRAYVDHDIAEGLAEFRGMRIAGHILETDLDAIDLWARRGELRVEDIYSLTS